MCGIWVMLTRQILGVQVAAEHRWAARHEAWVRVCAEEQRGTAEEDGREICSKSSSDCASNYSDASAHGRHSLRRDWSGRGGYNGLTRDDQADTAKTAAFLAGDVLALGFEALWNSSLEECIACFISAIDDRGRQFGMQGRGCRGR
jgi:hypothetical protein